MSLHRGLVDTDLNKVDSAQKLQGGHLQCKPLSLILLYTSFKPSATENYGCKQSRRRTCLCASVHLQNLCFHHHHKQAFPFVLQISTGFWICCKSHHGLFWEGASSWAASTRETAQRQNTPPLLMETFFTSVGKVNISCECEAIWSSVEKPDEKKSQVLSGWDWQ